MPPTAQPAPDQAPGSRPNTSPTGNTPRDRAGGASPARGRRSGHLYPQVASYLASRPGTELKVGEITRAIGAPSSGAVFEALKRMAAAGYATHRTDPHRFTVTQTGIDAAGTLPPPLPRTSAASGVGRSSRRQPVTRPNGDLYYPRCLAPSTITYALPIRGPSYNFAS